MVKRHKGVFGALFTALLLTACGGGDIDTEADSDVKTISEGPTVKALAVEAPTITVNWRATLRPETCPAVSEPTEISGIYTFKDQPTLTGNTYGVYTLDTFQATLMGRVANATSGLNLIVFDEYGGAAYNYDSYQVEALEFPSGALFTTTHDLRRIQLRIYSYAATPPNPALSSLKLPLSSADLAGFQDGQTLAYILFQNQSSGYSNCNVPWTYEFTTSTPAYQFSGFFPPVDNAPAVNIAKAGSAIPVKFSLNGDQGLDIFAVGSPTSTRIDCSSTATEDALEEVAANSTSGLQYDPVAQQYIYVWKSEKSWAGTCRRLTLKLKDGSAARTADFKFTK